MTTSILRSTPTLRNLIAPHIQTLFTRHRWELLAIGAIVWIYQFLILEADAELPSDILTIGGPGFPGAFIFSCLAVFWAIRIWDGLSPGSRETLHSYPIDRTLHHGLRVSAGLVLLSITLVTFWLIGSALSAVINPELNWYTNTLLYGSSWIISILGLVNAYLLGTCLALLCRRPELWFFVWIPVGFIVLSLTAQLLNSEFFVSVFRIVFLGFFSVLALLGTPFTDPRWRPDILIMLGGTLILVTAVLLASRKRR